jgi:response regulator RpfG family c-di-GMP phosphodiesterase
LKSTQKKKIFIARKKPPGDILCKALEHEFDLIFCDSLEQAKLLLEEPVDLIFCTMLFDGSRMFELLRYVKANPATKSIPFVGARVAKGTLPLYEVETAMKATKLLGAKEFVDLHTWINQLGEEQAFEKLRTTIRQLL